MKNPVRDRFFQAIEELNLSVYEVAKSVGVSDQALSNYKTGKTKHIRAEMIGDFCRLYGVSLDFILYGSAPMLKVVKKGNSCDSPECNKLRDKIKTLERQIHHLVKELDNYETAVQGYRDEISRLNGKQETKKAVNG